MSAEPQTLSRRVLEEVSGGTNQDAADEIYAPEFVDHDPTEPDERSSGPEGIKAQALIMRSAFPDLEATVEDQLTGRDLVVTRYTMRGTHQGEWTEWDLFGLMSQLGAIPARYS